MFAILAPHIEPPGLRLLSRATRPKRLASSPLLILLLWLSCGFASATWAATFVVDTTIDSADPAYRVCSAAADDCSLRGAVLEANLANGFDTVQLAAGATYVLSLGAAWEDAGLEGDLDVTEDLQVLGHGAVIDAAGLDRIFDLFDADLTLDDTTLVHGAAISSLGGAIRSVGGTGQFLHITDSTLEDNGARYGGAIYMEAGRLVIETSTLRSNDAELDGGAVFVASGTVHLDYTTLLANTSYENGGAVAFSGTELTMTHTVFDGNRRLAPTNTGNGGALYVGSGDVVGIETDFLANVAEYTYGLAGRGGAVFADEGTSLDFDRAVFEDNVSNYHGGAIYTEGTLSLTNSTVRGNSSTFDGGGLALFTAITTIDQVSLENNVGRFGGAIYAINTFAEGSDLTVTNSDFLSNEAGTGGGIYHRGSEDFAPSTLFVENVDFRLNRAIWDGGSAIWNQGGFADAQINDIWAWSNRGLGSGSLGTITNFQDSSGPPLLELLRADIVQNTTTGFGGGLYNTGHARVLASEIHLNTADVDGGGIFSGGSGSRVVVNRSLIAENTALDDGGGIYVIGSGTTDEARAVLNNSTVSQNTAHDLGGGLVVTVDQQYPGPAKAHLYNATVFNNIGQDGPGDAILANDAEVHARNSIVATPNEPDCATMFGGSIVSYGYNIESQGSCGFTDPGDRQFTLPLLQVLGDYGGSTRTHATQGASPAIDGANPTGCVADRDGDGLVDPNPLQYDQRLVGRVGICDVGAFENVAGN